MRERAALGDIYAGYAFADAGSFLFFFSLRLIANLAAAAGRCLREKPPARMGSILGI
jgi:hypothetical protein